MNRYEVTLWDADGSVKQRTAHALMRKAKAEAKRLYQINNRKLRVTLVDIRTGAISILEPQPLPVGPLACQTGDV
jgi:hypothetical protein